MIQQHTTNASSPKLLIESHRHTSYHHRILYLILLMNTLPTTTTTTYIYLPTHQPTNHPTSPFPLPTPHPSVPPTLRPSVPPPDTHTTYTPPSSPSRQRSHQIKSNQIKPKTATSTNSPPAVKKEKRKIWRVKSGAFTHTHTHTRARPRRRQVL